MNTLPDTICICAENAACRDKAMTLSQILEIPCLPRRSGVPFYLLVTSARLELHHLATPGAVFVDFVDGSLGHRRQYGGGRKQPLARAIGLKSGVTPSVVDATAGLGKDAFVLASIGCQVQMFERSPILAALIQDGLERALANVDTHEIAQRMTLINADATTAVQELDDTKRSIYLDPMYPEKKKSALVKKEMQMLHKLIGPDMDSNELFTAALTHNTGRVVVKRPIQSAYLSGQTPTVSINSKKTRYDIYVSAALTPE